MLTGYVCVAESDPDRVLESYIEKLLKSGVERKHIYHDRISTELDSRPSLMSCLQNFSRGDTLIIWELGHLGHDPEELVYLLNALFRQHIGLSMLSGSGISIDSALEKSNSVHEIFAALAEAIKNSAGKNTAEVVGAGNCSDRRNGPKFALSKSQIVMVQTAMQDRNTNVSELCKELNITRQTLYRYFSPNGALRKHGERVLSRLSEHTWLDQLKTGCS